MTVTPRWPAGFGTHELAIERPSPSIAWTCCSRLLNQESTLWLEFLEEYSATADVGAQVIHQLVIEQGAMTSDSLGQELTKVDPGAYA